MSGLTVEYLTLRYKELVGLRNNLQKSLSDAEIAIHQTTGRIAQLEELLAELKKGAGK